MKKFYMVLLAVIVFLSGIYTEKYFNKEPRDIIISIHESVIIPGKDLYANNENGELTKLKKEGEHFLLMIKYL